ncbi:MAG: peptidoglycan-binding protein [Pseudomonadota bacterium]
MTNRRHQGVGNDGTLDRLNDALSALENRIAGTARGAQRARDQLGLDDVTSIRQREAALRAQHAPMHNPNSRQAEFAALRDKLQSSRVALSSPSGSAVSDLRADIESLKATVTHLARQDSLIELSDRWSVVEREIARLPETLASRDDMAAMAARLENMSQVVAAMPQNMETRALEDRIQTLAAAMEAFGEQQAGLERSLAGGFDDRFSAIDRAIENLNRVDAGVDRDALDRIEARVVGLNRQLEDMQSGAGRDYAPMFEDMLQRLDSLQAASNEDPAVHDALTLIAERVADLQAAPAAGSVTQEAEMQALTQRLDQIVDMLQSTPAAGPSFGEDPAVRDIEARLDALTAQLSQSAETTGKSVEQAVVGLESRIDELGQMLHGREAADASAKPLENVEERLDDIARFLAQTAHSTPSSNAAVSVDTEALEVQIAELTARLSDTSNSIASATPLMAEGAAPVDVMEAARTAAEQVLSQANLSGTNSTDIERLSDDLRSLETLARESDGRHERTFEAIHDTLLKIVDHLSDLEHRHGDQAQTTRTPQPDLLPSEDEYPPQDFDDVTDDPPLAIPSQAGLYDSPPTGRMPIDDAPPIDSDGRGPRSQELTPAQAAASAAIAAMANTDGPAAPSADAVPEKKSILQAMTNRFTRSDVAEEAAEGASGDTPLEPDTAQAEVAEIIARVRREREGGDTSVAPAVAIDAGAAPRGATSGSKSDFIAAARRAAQAAASDAQAAEARVTSKSSGLKSSVANVLATKRRPILIGAAAILLAILALPMIRGLMGGDNAIAVNPTPPAPIIEQQAEPLPKIAPVEPEETITAEPQEDVSAPRIISTETVAVNEALEAPSEGASVVAGEIAAEPVIEIETPVEPEQIIVSAIPTDAGTPAMQDAARAGEPVAMFLIGDYHAAQAQTGQIANADSTNVEALAWYTKSAEAGYAPAQQRLGSLYEKGIGTERDLQLAKSWYQQAAEKGNSAAMHNLGVLHANGVDGQPNLTEAVSWFEQAALFGVPDSQYNLGVMAVRGDGMDPSLRDSYKWFALAAQSGDPDAADKRDTVAERMDPETLKMARDEVALWRPRQLDQTANIVSVPEAWQTDQMRTAAAQPDEPIDMQKAVQNIQAILNANGYNAGPVDGLMGNQTREAISAFQADNGMDPTGEVNEELVRKLLALAG